ncbi:carbohydrate esterase family 4 protein [Mycena albidolilacea]|uniref:Carbohydrate esterase family 4 protein n=1 Tax=Mycena albidolilacea TaxID=1033008 RepID=A0AAD7EWS1_9AGAR|nr:carbohydrate esterase family 4 protein [Mycena albidolilacea]
MVLGVTFWFLLSSALSVAEPTNDLAASRKAVVYSSCKIPNTAALTFDDGPYKFMTNISDLLVSKGAKGTFFVNGDNYACIYDTKVAARLQYAYSNGHQICSHTWSHPDLQTLSENEIAGEIAQVDIALMKILGVASPFIRPPFGSYNTLVRQVAFQQNKSLVLWDTDSEDSLNATVAQSEGIYDDAISANLSTILALNHETEQTTAQELIGYAVDALQAANYSLVTVAECLGLEPYSFVGQLGQRDTTWFCPEDDDS